ncbi:tRNA pseudouridine(55) synthase TruB [Chryseotalea sanaruensis]|uniref:tRNA pseudouridine synthase B n=1 Tax=Chryseotalea sanaruensis TaxID=2482724 RepID=A0A401UAF7_9BACT|nr:tRNA pseudouridine(55) synthase TruB [Chryseotalea sanaruensis]GCC51867.1 tRNA pseudouridine(55) synthase TruB [Chryseotalea sanaruensis]
METIQQPGQVLLINKPLHWTSFDVVKKLRYKLKIKKIGHAGTLDPLATGLLIVCSGKMTKSINDFMGMEKEYTGSLVIGQTTASYDLETTPTDPVDITHINEGTVQNVVKSFIGLIQQTPPLHSAIKVNGKRAYELARAGEAAELKKREVEIKEFEIVAIDLPRIDFRVVCSKGTYIRSLARDVGESLGVGAYLSALCRTRIGTFKLEDALQVEEVLPPPQTLTSE